MNQEYNYKYVWICMLQYNICSTCLAWLWISSLVTTSIVVLSMERVVQGEPEPVGRHHHHHHREAWVLVRALNWEILWTTVHHLFGEDSQPLEMNPWNEKSEPLIFLRFRGGRWSKGHFHLRDRCSSSRMEHFWSHIGMSWIRKIPWWYQNLQWICKSTIPQNNRCNLPTPSQGRVYPLVICAVAMDNHHFQ